MRTILQIRGYKLGAQARRDACLQNHRLPVDAFLAELLKRLHRHNRHAFVVG